MPIIPVRDLAKGGIIKDVHPFALEPQAFSDGRNVVFLNGKACRSPVWRQVYNGIGTNARFCAAITPTTGQDQLVIAHDDASLSVYTGGNYAAASETGFTAKATVTAPWTSCELGDVLYINRPDGIPRVLLPGASQFVPLANWPASWKANVIRAFQDQIVVLGSTQGAASLPAQINLSDLTFFGQVPPTWDSTNATTLAYANNLAQLDGPILDGLTLNGNFVFYTAHQVWSMVPGGSFNFQFFKLFDQAGIIGTNCVVEVNGLHYVFGSRDIYVTDGNTIRSIADGRIRQWLYQNLNTATASRCFVQFLPVTNEVLFAHVSGDPSCAWANPTGCNNAWKYCITTDTWAPDDLPNVSSMALCNLNTELTWATATNVTWEGIGGAWYDLNDLNIRHAAAINTPLAGVGNTTTIDGNGCVLGYDFVDSGQLTAEVDLTCCAPSFVTRTGITLDATQMGNSSLNTSKTVRAIYPEMSVSRAVDVTINTGSSMTPAGVVTWDGALPFDPINDYQFNTRTPGRYLAIEFAFDPLADTQISGFDIDVMNNGRR